MGLRSGSFTSLVALLLLAGALIAPNTVHAQDRAGIAGTVEDETGLVLPGVSVEAASPALIEQRRNVVTDGAGNYRIINLPPGTYSVTFSLQGFRTVVREGIVLEGSFTANVDAELTVGQIAETVTVSGVAPLVDVVNTRKQIVLTTNEVNALPAATSILTAMQYAPGVDARYSFLATAGDSETRGPQVHGSEGADGQGHIDGVETGTQLGGRSQSVGGVGLISDEAAIAEMVFDTGSLMAEHAQSGIRTNMIPKSGANTYSGELFLDGTNDNFAFSNLSPELEDQGFAFAPTAWSYGINPAFGGPIVEDKLWFFGSYVRNRNKTYRTDIFFDPDEPSTPDGLGDDLRAFGESTSSVQNIRITYQLNQTNKITSSFTNQQNDFGRVVGTGFGRVSAEALFDGTSDPNYLSTTRWTATPTDRLLIEGTFSYQRLDLKFRDFDENGIGRVAFRDVITGLSYGTSFLQDYASEDHRRMANASVSYVTGSHNFKAGFQYIGNIQYFRWKNNGDIFQAYTFNGWPGYLLVMGNGDAEDLRRQNCECGIYAQDAWTVDRFTINLGVRYDWFDNSLAGGTRPAGWFTPEIVADPIEDLPSWQNWSGRFGLAYDLFGDGRTALKAFAGRYVANEALGITSTFSPFGTNIDYRTWFDANGDRTVINPDGTPQLAEIGPSFNPIYGQPRTANRLDPDAPRRTNWEYNAGIEHELGSSWSVSAKWIRREFGNFRWWDNTSIDSGDYAATTFTGPVDPRLPGGGGQQLTVYDLADPNFPYSTGDIFVTGAPDDSRTWNGFEVIFDGRLWRDGFAQASWTGGEVSESFCTSPRLGDPGGDPSDETPNFGLDFCDNSRGFRNNFKFSGGIPLPFDTMISGLFQVFAGNEILATYQATAVDLGRPLVGPAQIVDSLDAALITPGTQFEDFTTQLNIRFQKLMTLPGGVRIRAYMDASNLFNGLTVFTRNRYFGGGGVLNDDFYRPIQINAGRVLSFGTQVSF